MEFESVEDIYIKFKYTDVSKYEYMSDYILNLYNYGLIEMENSDKLLWNGNYFKDVKQDYEEMKKYYLMAIELDNKTTIEICVTNNYFNDDIIKNAILKKNFTIINKTITCPISLEDTEECYITKCNHEFSNKILECVKYSLCKKDLFL